LWGSRVTKTKFHAQRKEKGLLGRDPSPRNSRGGKLCRKVNRHWGGGTVRGWRKRLGRRGTARGYQCDSAAVGCRPYTRVQKFAMTLGKVIGDRGGMEPRKSLPGRDGRGQRRVLGEGRTATSGQGRLEHISTGKNVQIRG